MADTLGTNTSGFDYVGQTYRRAFVRELIDKKLREQYMDPMVFKPFIGTKGEQTPIIMETDLKKEPGDTVKIGMLPGLDAVGYAGDVALEDNEEPLEFSYVQCYVNQLRNAVKEHGKMSSQRGFFKILDSCRVPLQTWFGRKIDDSLFRACYYKYPPHILGTAATYGGLGINSSAPTPPRYWYCADSANNSITYSGTASTHVTNIQNAEGTLANTASDKMSPSLLESMGALMRVQNLPYVSVKGHSGYLAFLHPYQVAQLRQHETWFNAMQNGAPRDEKGNPIFAGVDGGRVVGYWNGFLIIESNLVSAGNPTALMGETVITSGSSNGANVRRAIFMGANALAYGVASEPHLEVKEDFDYNNKTGIAVAGIFGIVRADYILDTSDATRYDQNIFVCSTYSPATTV